MSSLNCRVIEFSSPTEPLPWRAIHEVYYDEDGRPVGTQLPVGDLAVLRFSRSTLSNRSLFGRGCASRATGGLTLDIY